jgi:LPS O-antigen subunit length determinant protein (WzzB/FepE family)
MRNSNQGLDEGLDFHDLLEVIRRERVLILAIVVCCVGTFVAATALIPRKYKSSAQLGIYSEYFQNPLIKDFLPETYETTELRSQRETLVRSTFDSEFLDQLGEKYHLYRSMPATPKRIIERQEFAKNIETYLVQGTTVQVTFTGQDANQSFGIVGDIVERAQQTLMKERRKTVENLRNSIRERLDSLAISDGLAPAPAPLSASRPIVLDAELARLESQISTLSQLYTPHHPEVRRLQQRADLLRSWLKRGETARAAVKNTGTIPPKSTETARPGGEPREVSKQVYEDLVRKLSYLDIVLAMDQTAKANYVTVIESPTLPTSPIYPRPAVFAFWGLLVGCLLATFTVLLREFFERNALSMENFAENVGAVYLGAMPRLDWTQDVDGVEGELRSPTRAMEGELDWPTHSAEGGRNVTTLSHAERN